MSFPAIPIEVITVDPVIADSLEALGKCKMWQPKSFLYKCNFGRSSSELAELIPFPYYLREVRLLF